MVVVQGESREAIIPALDAVVRETSAQPKHFQAVLHEIDLTKLREKGLYYLSPDELRTIEGFLNDVEPIIRGGWQWLSPGAMATGILQQARPEQLQQAGPEQLRQSMAAAQVKVAEIAESLLTALARRGPINPLGQSCRLGDAAFRPDFPPADPRQRSHRHGVAEARPGQGEVSSRTPRRSECSAA